jgi:hypothetical protein
MTIKRAIALALIALAAVPAAASAQEDIPPPGADNYLSPYFFNDETHPLGYDPLGLRADTTSYTVQTDMFNPPAQGGPAEPNQCGNSVYGNTIWSVFYSSKWGLMSVSTAGNFDAVIGVVPFDSPNNPIPDFRGGHAFCFDHLAGFQESAKFQGEPYSGFIIVPKQWYAIQVGGTTQTGTAPGGALQVKIDQNHSPELDGDVILSWAGKNGQAKITKLIVSAPKGAKVAVTCTHHGCGRNPKAFTVRKARFTKPVGLVGPSSAAKAPAGVRMRPASVAVSSSSAAKRVAGGSALRERRAVVHAAKKFKLLAGRKLKNGSKVEIRITRPGFVGKYFAYSVSKGQVASKKVFCLNPSSSKPRKKCG